MNRPIYFEYIENHLGALCYRINTNGKLNNLGLHTHSETFYQHFFNELYGWQLRDLNSEHQNVEGIDLVDDINKIVVQVSATCTKDKIEDSLKKDIVKNYSNYCFKFISISKEADGLRGKIYNNPNKIIFDPNKDIFDSKAVLSYIRDLDIQHMKRIYKFIKEELGGEVDVVKLDSNLATIINTLSKENWDISEQPTTNSFEIDRKIIYNNLKLTRYIIDDYSAHYARVDKKYSEFDTQGVNKSGSVLAKIRKEYQKNIDGKTDDEVFLLVIDGILQQVLNSANLNNIPIDEIELCVNILVVDAFIRCKIFKNPNGYKP